MKYALISEEQISQAEGYLASACADPSVSVGLLKVLHIIQSLKPSEPVAFCALTPNGMMGYFDGKPMIMVGKVGNDCHTTPLYVLDEVTK